MSFILDALRKSEHERQRQTGPALVEVAVAPAKPRSNVWATAAIALLLVNLVAVGVFLIRKASRTPAAETPVATAPAPRPMPAAAPSVAPAQVTLTQTVPAAAPTPPPMLQPARAPEPSPSYAGSRNPLEDEMQAGAPSADPELVAEASAVPAGPPAVRQTQTKRGSVVYESLPESATLGSPQHTGAPPAAGNAATSGPKLPTADEIAAAGGVPALNLDLHVYSTKPSERMAFINSRKYREGDQLQEGPVVRQITAEGVILELNGRTFLLSRD